MKTLITLVRHGETEWNVAMRLQGKQDSPLTEQGILQIEKSAIALKHREFDILVSSDLGRAWQTAREINKYQSLEILPEKRFRERNFGVMEGLTLAQIKARYALVYEGYITRTADFQVPEGESLVQFSKRVLEGFQSLLRRFSGKRILVVAHGGVLDCLMRRVFDLPLDAERNFSIYNAAINTFSFENNGWKLEEWGNIDHLEAITNPRDELNEGKSYLK